GCVKLNDLKHSFRYQEKTAVVLSEYQARRRPGTRGNRIGEYGHRTRAFSPLPDPEKHIVVDLADEGNDQLPVLERKGRADELELELPTGHLVRCLDIRVQPVQSDLSFPRRHEARRVEREYGRVNMPDGARWSGRRPRRFGTQAPKVAFSLLPGNEPAPILALQQEANIPRAIADFRPKIPRHSPFRFGGRQFPVACLRASERALRCRHNPRHLTIFGQVEMIFATNVSCKTQLDPGLDVNHLSFQTFRFNGEESAPTVGSQHRLPNSPAR